MARRLSTLILTVLTASAAAADKPATDSAPSLDYEQIPKAAAWERARWHVQKRLGEGMETLPMNALEPARQARAKLPRSNATDRYAKRHPSRPKAPAAWEALGPNQKGGRTRRLIFDSTGTALAAGVSGGVWRLERGRWVPLGDRLVNVNVGALVVSPVNDKVLYAGTGELYRRTNRPYSNMTGAGIFKSTNGGADWLQLAATRTENFAYVSDIVISPQNPERLYAATNTGIWRSDDGGVSFGHSLSTDEGSGNRYEGCTDLSVRVVGEADQVLATCASRSRDDRYFLPGLGPETCGTTPCDARVYLNEDAGGSGTWQITLSEPGMGRTSLAVAPSNPDVVYALSASVVPGPDKTGDGVGDYDNGLHAVHRSDDGGRSWTATLRNSDNDPVGTFMLAFAWQARVDGNTPYGAGWYNQAIAVDPNDPDVVWVGGMQLYRSDDGGRRFGLTSNYFGNEERQPGSSGPAMHPDIHTLMFDASDRLWIGNDGGVWIADNQDAPTDFENDGYRNLIGAGVTFTPVVTDFTTTQFYHGTVSPDGGLVIGGMQDNGTDAIGLPGFANQWVGVLGGDGSYSAFDHERQNIYSSAQNAAIYRLDADYNYTNVGAKLREVAFPGDEFMFITPFILDPSDTTRIYLAGKRLYRGTGFGEIWQVASQQTGTTFQDKANAIAVSPTRPSWALIGTGKAIYRHTLANLGTSSRAMTSTTPRSGWVSSLLFDPNDENVAYATYSSLGGDHVWKSTDGGESFFPIDGGGAGRLPDVPVHSLAVDPLNPDHLYIGTDLGVFFTEDGGANWQVEETGFGGAIVERVVINEPSDDGTAWLFAFTYGRGVWRAPLADVDGAPGYTITPRVNGFWFDDTAPGHGLQVQLIDQGGAQKLLVAWYVYENGEPLWLIGVGDVSRDRAVIPMTITRGGAFGEAFDPDRVVRDSWGELELVFAADDDVSVRWQSGFGAGRAGTLAMTKLSNPTAVTAGDVGVSLCSTGTYWNPAQDGQGLLVETVIQDGEPALAWSWYHYRDGRQLWLVGSGRFDGNAVVADAFIGSSGEFPPAFDPDAAQVDRWGAVRFDFTGERSFTLSWEPDGQPEGAGSLAYEQLAALADSGCD
ncbi:MAG: hypothetical protein AAGE01_12830 [Pseudomonadota bacterium]